MAATAGYGGAVRVGAAVVADVTGWNADIEMDSEETTALRAAGGAKTHVPTLYGGSGEAEANFNMGDTNGQRALQNALFNRTEVDLALDTAETGTNRTYSGKAWVLKVSPSLEVDGVVKVTFGFTFNGPITFS